MLSERNSEISRTPFFFLGVKFLSYLFVLTILFYLFNYFGYIIQHGHSITIDSQYLLGALSHDSLLVGIAFFLYFSCIF